MNDVVVGDAGSFAGFQEQARPGVSGRGPVGGIGTRLLLAFGAMLALAVVVAAFALSRLAQINDNTRELDTHWLLSSQALSRYADDLNQIRRAEIGAILARTATERLEWLDRIEEAKRGAAGFWSGHAAALASDTERNLLAAIRSAQDRYFREEEQTLDLLGKDGGRELAIDRYAGASRDALRDVANAIRTEEAFQKQGGNDAFQQSQATYRQACIELLALVAGMGAFGAAMSILITRSITRPLGQAVTMAGRVAEGDLHIETVRGGKDETGQLLRSLGAMRQSLLDVVAQVRASSDSIATGARQIAAGSKDLSERTELEARRLQQTAAAMEHLTATVRRNADDAHSAMKLADVASDTATAGRTTVGRMVETMDEIAGASAQVRDIINVIDGIAFQTNILALNAAVEAARAGARGSGFGVVASEVRALAQRCATAAREIKSLITTSALLVEDGAGLARRVDDAIARVSEQIAAVSELMREIATANARQRDDIAQIGTAVSELDTITQQNAALAEESMAAAESLSGHASRLVETMRFFRHR